MRASLRIESAGTFAAGLNAPLKIGLCAAGSIAAMFLDSPLALSVMLAAAMAFALTAASLGIILRTIFFTTMMLVISFAFTWPLSHILPQLFRWNVPGLSVPFLRFQVVILLVLTMALSTSVRAVESTLTSLRLPGFLFIPLLVAVRFVPTFIDDCKQIREAVRLRPGGGILSIWRGIVVPLVFRMLSSASDLAIAAELKGMSATKKLRRPVAKTLARGDFLVLALAAATVFAAFTLQIHGPRTAGIMP